ncbi:MAG TPA: peptidylprolyl isomerase [Acidimicrobiales bacterium]|nr:peptidylprolyl isomerase [Acidimicrobiales bacterium]
MTRTPRLLAVALVLLLAGALSACSDSTTSGVALTVDGTEVPQSAIDTEIDDLAGLAEACPSSPFATSFWGQGGSGTDNVSTTATANILQRRVVAVILEQEFERRDLEVSDEALAASEQDFVSQLDSVCGSAPADPTSSTTVAPDAAGVTGQEAFDALSAEYQEFQARLGAQATALGEELAAEAAEENAATDEEVRAFYDENQSQFDQRCVSHILVDDEATATDLLSQLEGGADFATLAQANSTDTGSATQGGDLGCQAAGAFVPEFEAAIDEATEGEVFGPVETEFGFHLLLVESKGVQPFAEVEEQIRQQLEDPGVSPLDAFINEALAAADVEVNPRYGTWDAETLTVIPPEGPTTPTTLPVLPDPGTAPTLPAAGG